MSEVGERIDAIREEWGDRLLILGHHYQRPSVLAHADKLGDSLELSRLAADQEKAERIVFCGVHFMAESADILTSPEQIITMPETGAGCPMADMATAELMQTGWNRLAGVCDDWLPVVYVNSTARIKALCGKLGGSTCTSSNAGRVFEWALEQGKRIFFLPDEHLGRNTAATMGIPDDEVALYNPACADGGLSDDEIRSARVVVWKGYCIVHVAFTINQIRQVRAANPDATIIVHPETPREAADLADGQGSTSQIIKAVEAAPDGSTLIIGTEQHLVERLAREQAGRVTVKCLKPSICANMAKTNEHNLLRLLEEWPDELRIHVSPSVADNARLALQRMLEL
ncbi:MAG: quinolinate synthase NadA [Kiritimatiellia bacterium]|nr:quinolinate synthase NadA [Kiritimatiellia bacterium]MDP6810100.1 quinolinate synthase NadA [Kiritimatiellia bacterium]MDP7024871.1 quinolinate synthase NadA [Kiritimatiellia bacterium]